MAHNPFHSAYQGITNFLGSPDTADLRQLLSAAGQAGTALMAANRLEGLGSTAKTDLASIYDDITDTSKFQPFSVTA